MSLSKNAAAFTPKWMTSGATTAAPAAPQQPAPAATTTTATDKPKLSSGAAAFVPRSMRTTVATPSAAPAAPAPAAKSQPQQKSVADLGSLPPRAPQGAWGKRPPLGKSVSPAAKPATPGQKPATPGQKPATPGSKPGTPGSKPITPGGRPAAPGEVYRPPPKLLTELMKQAKATQLKKDAEAYVPKHAMPPPMKMVTPPVTPQQSPAAAPTASHVDPNDDTVADENAKMPLSRPWALYFVDRAPQGQAAYDPTLVYTMKSVEDFWRTINNVPSLTHGNPGSTYYFFRDGIQPKWEDAGNQGGGSWTMRLFSSRDLTSEAIDEIWDRLLCRAVGEAWSFPSLKGNLTGLVAKMRDRAITIQFWVTRRVDDFPREIMELVGDLYKAFTVDYLSHEAAKEAAAEREKLEREKAKAQKKKDKKRH